MKEIRWDRTAAILVSILAGGALFYLFFRYALPLLLPFLLAFAVSMIIRPMAEKLAKRTRIPRGVLASVLLLLVFGFGGWGVWAGSVHLISELGELAERLLSDGGVLDAMDALMLWAQNMSARVGLFSAQEGNAQAFHNAIMQMVGDMLSSLASRLPDVAASLFSALPAVIFFLIVSVVACFYFCTDNTSIGRLLGAFVPNQWREKFPRIRENLRDVLHKYLKAYGILLFLTFGLLLVGFWILGVEYAFLLAFLIALADLLPVIGVGTILIPWGIVMLLQKNFYVGFGLLILFLVISLIRQVAEPRVLGKSLGLHPLLTLFSIYVGFSLFGLPGMILAPVLVLLVKRVIDVQIKKA